MDLTELPAFNASMNGVATVLLTSGLIAIKRGRKSLHASLMIAAFASSAVFLAGYLTYHFVVIPELGHTEFHGEGLVKLAYYGMLISHILLAVVNLPMVLRTLWLAWKRDWERHKRWARWTFPIWLYVSVTGIVVYVVLYHLNPSPPA